MTSRGCGKPMPFRVVLRITALHQDLHHTKELAKPPKPSAPTAQEAVRLLTMVDSSIASVARLPLAAAAPTAEQQVKQKAQRPMGGAAPHPGAMECQQEETGGQQLQTPPNRSQRYALRSSAMGPGKELLQPQTPPAQLSRITSHGPHRTPHLGALAATATRLKSHYRPTRIQDSPLSDVTFQVAVPHKPAPVSLPKLAVELVRQPDETAEKSACGLPAAAMPTLQPTADVLPSEAVAGTGLPTTLSSRLAQRRPAQRRPAQHRTSSCPFKGSRRMACLSDITVRSRSGGPALSPRSRAACNARRAGRASAGRGNALENMLATSEKELDKLERRLRLLACHQVLAGSTPGCGIGISGENRCERDGWRANCLALGRNLEDLSALALECSCNRDTYGAMDVFEQANSALDRLATLLRRSAETEVEAQAPAGCDRVEWRVVASSLGSTELEALHTLALEVGDCVLHPSCTATAGVPLCGQPATLLRFLRAKEGNVGQAARMFRASLDWRASKQIDNLAAAWVAEEAVGATWRARLVERFKVHKVIGTDRLGLPVYLFRWGVFDIAGAERELGTEMVVQIILSIHEEVASCVRKAMLQRQETVPGALFIWDVGNYGQVPQWVQRMWSLIRFLPRVARVLEANYPELVRHIAVVRCGAATMALHRAVALMMPARTLGKCRLFGWHAAEWLPELQRELPGVELPAFLACDNEAVLEAAEPRGGLYPVGTAAAEDGEVGQVAPEPVPPRRWSRQVGASLL